MNREQMVDRADEVLTWIAEDNCEPTWGIRQKAEKIVDAILPQVSTVEELEALPIGAVVVGRNGWTWTWSHTKHFGGQDLWLGIQGMCDHGDLVEHYSPLTVVWQP